MVPLIFTDAATAAYLREPEYRGKGLAQGMFGKLVRLAKLQGIKEMTLEVLEENVRARAIYERAGFIVLRKLFSLECKSNSWIK